MATSIGTLTRAATRRTDEPLNILTFPTHERYESGLCKTGHNFYAVRAEGIKDWNRNYAPLPENYTLLNPGRGDKQVPAHIDFDFILSQNKFGQFQIAHQLSTKFHLPLVSLEHTLPVPGWNRAKRESVLKMRGHLNVFISEYSINQWGFDPSCPSVRTVHHGIDTDIFSPNDLITDRKPTLLSVVNDWKNRDWCCGFKLWQDVTKGLPTVVVGDTPGLSKPAASVADLVMKYRQSEIFLNTSLISPVPTALLEAMSCGCAIVSTENCMIPEVIENGVNGFMSNDPKRLAEYCQMLLHDAGLCRAIGDAARRTILDKFSMTSFVDNWNRIFHEAASLVYVGPT